LTEALRDSVSAPPFSNLLTVRQIPRSNYSPFCVPLFLLLLSGIATMMEFHGVLAALKCIILITPVSAADLLSELDSAPTSRFSPLPLPSWGLLGCMCRTTGACLSPWGCMHGTAGACLGVLSHKLGTDGGLGRGAVLVNPPLVPGPTGPVRAVREVTGLGHCRNPRMVSSSASTLSGADKRHCGSGLLAPTSCCGVLELTNLSGTSGPTLTMPLLSSMYLSCSPKEHAGNASFRRLLGGSDVVSEMCTQSAHLHI